MRKSIWIIVGIAGVALILTMLFRDSPRRSKLVVSGPLTPDEIHEIEYFISHERASLIQGEFAPHDAANLGRKLRERAAGVLRRISSEDGQRVVVDFGDRWDSKRGYDYELQRTTNGWRINSVGAYRRP